MAKLYVGGLPYGCNAKHFVVVPCRVCRDEPKPKRTIKFVVTPDQLEQPLFKIAEVEIDPDNTEVVFLSLKEALKVKGLQGFLHSADFDRQYYFNMCDDIDILRRFKDKYPSLANHVRNYRPADEPNSIIIWLDIRNAMTGSSAIIYNNETTTIKAAVNTVYKEETDDQN